MNNEHFIALRYNVMSWLCMVPPGPHKIANIKYFSNELPIYAYYFAVINRKL